MSRRNIICFNADLPLSDALCLDLLMCPPHREKVGHVWATVKDLTRAGSLPMAGVCLVEMGMEPDERHLTEYLKQVDCVVLTPDFTSDKMEKQAEIIIRCAKQAGVKQFILSSCVGIDQSGSNCMTAQKFLQIERCLKEAKLPESTIIRNAPVQQWLFLFRHRMLEDGKLCWPVKEDAQFTLVNFIDVVAVFRSEIIGSNQGRRNGDVQTIECTGTKKLTCHDLCSLLGKAAGRDVKFDHIDQQKMKQYLQNEVGFNNAMIQQVLDTFDLMENGRLNKISDDVKKEIGKTPETVEHFIEEHRSQFSRRH